VEETKAAHAADDVHDVNMSGMVDGQALYQASLQGKLKTVRWLLAQEGIDVNLGTTYGSSPLYAASACSHEAVVEALIAAGADVNHRHRRGDTVLMGASAYGHTTIARCLIAAGAHVNHADTDGWTALDWAQAYHRTATVEVLLTHRAMPGTCTTLPPLHTRLLRLLCKTHTPFTLSPEEALPGVLSETDVFGRTALHYAALTGDRAAYAVLRSAMRRAGVDREGVDRGGYTALDHLVCGCLPYGIFGAARLTSPRRALHCGHIATASCAC
jgi:ankyrin repeat protein